jgi:hypothetical protein
MRKLVPILALLVGCSAPWPSSSLAVLQVACQQAGNTQTGCDCFTAEVQKRMSHDDFVKWQEQIRIGSQIEAKYTNVMTEAGLACKGR